MPASSHCIEEFNEYLDYLWALYDSLFTEGFVIIIGDLNGDLGNSLGYKGCYAPNDRGLRLLDFAKYFNLCPINLLSICSGPLETFVSHCGLFKSTIDYILLPNCLHHSIVSCKTFEQTIENTSDHLPIQLKINFMIILVLYCLLIIALKWLLNLLKLDGQFIALKLFQHFMPLQSKTSWKL